MKTLPILGNKFRYPIQILLKVEEVTNLLYEAVTPDSQNKQILHKKLYIHSQYLMNIHQEFSTKY